MCTDCAPNVARTLAVAGRVAHPRGMGYPPRIQAPGHWYHVMSNGVDGFDVFVDEVDRAAFLALVGRELRRSEWTCAAYSLMSTHFHLLIQLDKPTLSSGMQHLKSDYTRLFNRRHGATRHDLAAPVQRRPRRDGFSSARGQPVHRAQRAAGGDVRGAGGSSVVQLRRGRRGLPGRSARRGGRGPRPVLDHAVRRAAAAARVRRGGRSSEAARARAYLSAASSAAAAASTSASSPGLAAS